jgi:hypothetical protein
VSEAKRDGLSTSEKMVLGRLFRIWIAFIAGNSISGDANRGPTTQPKLQPLACYINDMVSKLERKNFRIFNSN